MCGRYTLTAPPKTVADLFGLDQAPDFPARYNIAPSQPVAVIREDESHKRHLDFLRWGLIPSWAKEVSIGYKMINARAESVAVKPSFRSAFRSRRCLIPADGFYEWKREGKERQPYYVQAEGGQPFAFAGLWERWEDQEKPGTTIESCTVITTDANDLLRPIHDRMPVILAPGDYDRWLDPGERDAKRLLPLLVPPESEGLWMRPVSRYVNKVEHEGVECVAVGCMGIKE